MRKFKSMQFFVLIFTFVSLSFPSLAQKFEEISIIEFEANVKNLGEEVVKQVDISKKVALTSGKKSRGDFWSVTGVAMGSAKIFQVGKTGILNVTLIVKDTGKRFKSKYKLKRRNQYSKWKVIE